MIRMRFTSNAANPATASILSRGCRRPRQATTQKSTKTSNPVCGTITMCSQSTARPIRMAGTMSIGLAYCPLLPTCPMAAYQTT
ncbi:hypothetical protein D9V37_07100 [Nocardioides mangrovicus]|uniref:Uncharacterized protein n=1 Tax=Nocardioides mangrovicus TaxID=2478913 RepID=A0A3L8P3S8_9ACTN|nr:hypothetical protein D9V37_07100 [Nocardioides mangrovicus]